MVQIRKFLGACSHMVYTLHTHHELLAKKMQMHDIITAYDGLEVEL